jgi:hypothetical protein
MPVKFHGYWLSSNKFMTQISWVIKLVLTQWALDSNFFGNQAGSNATDAGQSNFR